MLKDTKRDMGVIFQGLASATPRQLAAWQRIRSKLNLYEVALADEPAKKPQEETAQ